jgi:hypothetical protein
MLSALSACSGFGPTHSHVSSAVIGHFKGLPHSVTVPENRQRDPSEKPWAAWAGPRSIYVMTWGSSSCPNIPTSVDAAAVDLVFIRTVEHDFHPGDDACTEDMAVTTSLVRLPSSIDTTRALVVQIEDTKTRLPAGAS